MSGITLNTPKFLGHVLEGFFYGLYSGIFVMYIQYQTRKPGTDKTKNLLFYALCVLYGLFFANFALGITVHAITMIFPTELNLRLIASAIMSNAIMGVCYFISHFILIYRCWIVWNCDIRVVMIPAILAFAFLGTWLAVIPASCTGQGNVLMPQWGDTITLTGLAISLTVHALVTGLIVFKIVKVYWEVNPCFDDLASGSTDGRNLRSIIFVLIESGTVLFVVQLARIVLSIMRTHAAREGFELILGIHDMLHGITPTIILVRVSMGLSFHDDQSMVEITSSLHFASSDDQKSILETENMSEEKRDYVKEDTT